MGIFIKSPTSTSVVRERRKGLTSSCVQVGHRVQVKWDQQGFQGSTGFQGNQSWGKGGWAPRDRSQWASRKGTQDTPSRHVPGRTGIQFPVRLTGDKGGVLRACSSCACVRACSSARHFWGLEPGASIYWPRLQPVGEVRQGGQLTGSQTALSVSLPSCPLHSLASCFHAVFGTGPSLARPEPGCPCLGHLSCCWVSRARKAC